MTAQERKQQEKQLRRRRIQQAARAVFDERGFAKTSIEMIAKSSSLSVGAIYLYFQSKEDLYASLLEESLGQMDETLQALGAANADLRTVLASLSAWMTQDQESARVFRLLATPGIQSQLSTEVKDAVRDGLGKLRAHLSAAIARGIHTGAYRAMSADQCRRTSVGDPCLGGLNMATSVATSAKPRLTWRRFPSRPPRPRSQHQPWACAPRPKAAAVQLNKRGGAASNYM